MRNVALVLAVVGCSDLPLDPNPNIIHARFDPDAGVIPMPSDVLRNAATRRLDLPNDTDAQLAKLDDAEKEFYTYLETLDGWSSLMSATVEMTAPIDPASITDATIQVWHWGPIPERVSDVRLRFTANNTKLSIDPPRTGWQRGERYAVVLRGGSHGAVGAHGEKVDCDAPFYFLRQTERLDTPEHAHAFPGDTQAERDDNARKLEAIREDLAPMFDYFATGSLPRDEVAALWVFTVTTKTELAMDQPSQRIPLPIDPATGRVGAPVAAWDRPVEAEGKQRLAELDGFGLSGSLLFELTNDVTASTFDASSVRLFQLGMHPVVVPATVEVLEDHHSIVVTPASGRLAEQTSYAVVVSDTVRDAAGQAITAMPIGHFLVARSPVLVDGHSQIHAIEDADATRLETSRAQLAPALDAIGRDHVLAAWPFTTMSVAQPLQTWREMAATLATAPDPANISHKSAAGALLDFPFGIGSILNVDTVYYGTIKSPQFLDPVTRSLRRDGTHVDDDIAFTLTTPKNPTPGPMPVVIFGHGLVTERRFVLAVGDALAAKGFAAISIDFPYHGERTYCATGGPISVVNPLDGSLVSLDPCSSGTTCNDHGKCVDDSGQGNALRTWGVIDMPVASGAVFLEIDHIANTKDHFQQALVDLGALDRSLHVGNWQAVLGRPIDTSRIYYAGQSLGGIMGAVFLGTGPNMSRAVLNVPGAGLVPMFDDSTFFGAQLDAFFQRQKIDRDSFDGR